MLFSVKPAVYCCVYLKSLEYNFFIAWPLKRGGQLKTTGIWPVLMVAFLGMIIRSNLIEILYFLLIMTNIETSYRVNI